MQYCWCFLITASEKSCLRSQTIFGDLLCPRGFQKKRRIEDTIPAKFWQIYRHILHFWQRKTFLKTNTTSFLCNTEDTSSMGHNFVKNILTTSEIPNSRFPHIGQLENSKFPPRLCGHVLNFEKERFIDNVERNLFIMQRVVNFIVTGAFLSAPYWHTPVRGSSCGGSSYQAWMLIMICLLFVSIFFMLVDELRQYCKKKKESHPSVWLHTSSQEKVTFAYISFFCKLSNQPGGAVRNAVTKLRPKRRKIVFNKCCFSANFGRNFDHFVVLGSSK